MTKIYLLTAPFDEDAKTGDGQYAASLEAGFARHYDTIPCTWLKKTDGAYTIPIPTGTTSIPEETIPSAMVLQPVANENTIISGYKLKNEHSSPIEAQDVNNKTVSPKTPKILVGHDDKLRSLTIMDIYSPKPIELDESKVKAIISDLETKKAKLTQAIKSNAATIPKKLKAKLAFLVRTYRENEGKIQNFCTLNEYVEAHIDNKRFLTRHTKALTTFEGLKAHFSGPINIKELEKLTDKLTGVKDYPYDFHSKNLPYDLENDKSFRLMYDFDSLKDSVDKIIKPLEALNSIRHAVVKSHSNSFKMLHDTDAELHEKLAFIDLIYNDGFRETYNKQEFINALLNPMAIDDVDEAIYSYTKISNKLADKKNVIEDVRGCRGELISELQSLISKQNEPYLSANKNLNGFYGKRKLSAGEGFHLAYLANQRDPLKPHVIANVIASMQPIDADTHLDIHIRPPDCGVFTTPEDIRSFQKAGIKVNITIHEYKQNYTRRYLQQYTHDLMREANSVQFFNEKDRDNAIIAATYGDCDKRNTDEPTGVAKKVREVGRNFDLDKYPIQKYNLKGKSGLTVASQQLSTAPAHPKDVVERAPNILSFGTIRPGKGFEEALKLAQLVKANARTIHDKIHKTPIVKLAGDPQDKELMQQIVEERFGKVAVASYQDSHAYDDSFSNSQRRDYWKALVGELNNKVSLREAVLNNPYIEIHPWCLAHELLTLKESCKYVCRMDDMGMRNNGSAIISVLDVGIVYTKFGSVTDDIFAKGGKYGKAVDIGEYRFGKYSLLKRKEEYIATHGHDAVLPKWLIKDPDSAYKRKSESRDPKDILDSIIAREVNQLQSAKVVDSENYQTVVEAQKLLTERFTLRNAAEHLLVNVGLKHLIVEEEVDDLFEVDPVRAQSDGLAQLADIEIPRFTRSHSWPSLGIFGATRTMESGLKSAQKSTKLDKIGDSFVL